MSLDTTDKHILNILLHDGRKKFLDVARQLRISGGTIHARIAKLKKLGVLTGFSAEVSLENLGYDIVSFIGVSLSKGADYLDVSKRLQKIPEILEVHYTTGTYSLFLKVVAKNMKDFHRLLYENLQHFEEVEHTETIVSLDIPFQRKQPEPLFKL